MKINEQIKKYRKLNNLTQQKLADKLNISFQSVSKWEQGISEPSIAYVIQMAEIFNISIDEFLDFTKKNEKVKPESFFKQLSSKKMNYIEAIPLIDNFLEETLGQPKGPDPTWEQGALRLLKGIICFLLNHGKEVNFNTIKETLLCNQINQDRQQIIVEKLKHEPGEIQSFVIQALDTPPMTFRSYLGVLSTILEKLEKI